MGKPKPRPTTASKRPVVLAVVSDSHCGSTVGLVPPEGVRLDDGGTYHPSKPQRWLWECWVAYWQKVAATVKREGAHLWIVVNGDLFEASHHGSTQIVSLNPDAQSYIGHQTFAVPLVLNPAKLFVVRGTEAHAGPGGSVEEAFARSIGAVGDPETKMGSWWHLRLAIHGVRIDCQHHGRMGQRPWTEANVVALLAAQIFYEHARRGIPYPHLAFRSHRHRFSDTGNMHPTRVIQTPSAGQLKTAYAHKVAAESIADVGGIITTIHPNGQYQVEPVLYQPSLPEAIVWQ